MHLFKLAFAFFFLSLFGAHFDCTGNQIYLFICFSRAPPPKAFPPPLLLTPEGLGPGELLIVHSRSSPLQLPPNGQQAFYYLLRHLCLNNKRKQSMRTGRTI